MDISPVFLLMENIPSSFPSTKEYVICPNLEESESVAETATIGLDGRTGPSLTVMLKLLG